MQRRQFLNYMLSIAALSCCACKKKNIDTDDKPLDNISSKKLLNVRIPICYHCNLNCAYCNHLSPLAPKYEMPVEVFEKDVRQLANLTNGKVRKVGLLGGEPLLHKKINRLLDILNYYFPDSLKRISTNATLLKNMPDSFWESCKRYKIQIKYSPYILYDNFPKENEILKLAKKHGVDIVKYTDKVTEFEHTGFNRIPKYKDNTKFNLCDKKRGCSLLDNGKFYACEPMGCIRFFNNYFKDYAIPITKNDYIDIHKVKTIDEIYNYLETPKEFCKYCGYGHDAKKFAWKISNKDVSEWYDVS